jgi:hypothetical protein
MSAVEVALALLAAFEAEDFPAAQELIAEDFSVTDHTSGRRIDRAGYLAAHRELAGAFGQLHREILDAQDEPPDEAVVTLRLVALNDRPVHLPTIGVDLETPTGRVLRTVPHVDHFTVRDGRVLTYRSEQPPGSGLRGLLDQIRQET